MSEVNKPYKVIFEPGCFDNFTGTQEELDELVKDIEQAFSDPDFRETMENVVDVSELTEDEQAWFNQVFDPRKRKLN
jgi:hypothetical protein